MQQKQVLQSDPIFNSLFDTDKSKICMLENFLHIGTFKRNVRQLEELTKLSYRKNSKHHEALVHRLWDNLMPGVQLTGRLTQQWIDIGF